MKKVFIVCPVRNATEEERRYIESYVASLEAKGHKVHYPPRDTAQDDPVGHDICLQNRRAIMEADEVHVYWNGASEGSRFDFGMAFATGKPIRIINREHVKPTKSKSINNVLMALDRMYEKAKKI